MSDPRPCERQCSRCKDWKHHSRFKVNSSFAHGTVGEKRYASFDPVCRDCRQIERNERKNADRPLAIIRARAQVAARKAGATTEFFWIQMNYQALVPYMRAMMDKAGHCLGCGHPFLNERDIQIEHIEPPRNPQDWARLHTRNLRLFCASCNGTKGDKPYGEWLDEQEEARRSNIATKRTQAGIILDSQPETGQLKLLEAEADLHDWSSSETFAAGKDRQGRLF
jgi:5-methylcytosine-specific restriction endonuclease McrA